MTTTKQLTTWNSSSNRSGIIQDDNSTELDDLIRDTQKELFTNMYNILNDKPVANLTKIWSRECDKIVNKLKSYLVNKYPDKDVAKIDCVIHKVRGNAGEIFVEKLVTEGYLNYLDVDKDSYESVNGFNENKEDGVAVSKLNPKVHIGVQVKNFSVTLVGKEVLMYAGYMDSYWSRQTDPSDMNDYRKFQRQIIISFTETENDKFFQDPVNASIVKFIGPREINRLLGNQPIAFFKEIAESI